MNLPFGFQPPDPSEDPAGRPDGQFSMAELGAALSQFGSMLQGMSASPDQGPVNWATAEDLARKAISSSGDPSVADAQRRAVAESVRLAELWLDPLTSFPSTGSDARAWSRSDWLTATMPAWRQIITPIAEQVQASMNGMMPDPKDLAGNLPEELRAMLPANMPVDLGAMLGPLMGMAKQMGAGMFAMQAGQGLAALAGEVLGAADVGLPLTTDGIPSLLPENVAAFGAGLGIDPGEIELYLAMREVAHQRLFTHVTWLGPTVRAAVAEYARGIGVDSAAMEQALRDVDISDPSKLQEALASGVLAPKDTPEQQAAVARLETLLALVEGWVDHVVSSAAERRLENASRLQEAMRRRRAVGGPAEKTFQSLVGLEMRPRRLRDAARLWSELERVRGIEGRDEVWDHPDLLPGPADLDDPESFVSGSSISDADLEALTSGAEGAGGGSGGRAGPAAEAAAPAAGAPSGEESVDTGADAATGNDLGTPTESDAGTPTEPLPEGERADASDPESGEPDDR